MKKFLLISPKNRTVYNFRGDLIRKVQPARNYAVIARYGKSAIRKPQSGATLDDCLCKWDGVRYELEECDWGEPRGGEIWDRPAAKMNIKRAKNHELADMGIRTKNHEFTDTRTRAVSIIETKKRKQASNAYYVVNTHLPW